MQGFFEYQRRVAFADTDAMGVVHHANYIHYCEEARVAWMRENGLARTHYPHTEEVLAVLQFQVWHKRPATFDDLLTVKLQVRRQGGVRVHFQYMICKDGEPIAEAETRHITVDAQLKPARPNPLLLERLEKEPWTETWLSNS